MITDTCWLWLGARNPRGYGVAGRGDKTFLAHRLAWEDAHGLLQPGLTLDHLCFNPSCVNPAHLEPITTQLNTARARAVGHKGSHYSDTCSQGHPFDGDNIRYDPKGNRHCVICDRASSERLSEKRRVARMARYGYDPGPRARFVPPPEAYA
jgi:hypothetical protein